MGFDKDEDKPLMNPSKPDTKSNIWMVIGVVVFFLFGAWALYRVWREPPNHADQVNDLKVP